MERVFLLLTFKNGVNVIRNSFLNLLLNIFSTKIKGPEFNVDKCFFDSWRLSILALVDIDTCHLWDHSFGPETVNLPILMKFCTLHKPRVVKSMVTIVFCDSWHLPILAIVNIGTFYLLDHSFRPKTANIPA